MIEIDCIGCGAEIERHQQSAVPVMQSMCDACSREVEAAGRIAQLDEHQSGQLWMR